MIVGAHGFLEMILKSPTALDLGREPPPHPNARPADVAAELHGLWGGLTWMGKDRAIRKRLLTGGTLPDAGLGGRFVRSLHKWSLVASAFPAIAGMEASGTGAPGDRSNADGNSRAAYRQRLVSAARLLSFPAGEWANLSLETVPDAGPFRPVSGCYGS